MPQQTYHQLCAFAVRLTNMMMWCIPCSWEIDPKHLPRHNWDKLVHAQRDAAHRLSLQWERKLIEGGVDVSDAVARVMFTGC